LTLFGYDLRYRAEESGVGEVSRSSAPYLVDASAMLFHRETLTGNAPAFVSLREQELLNGVALILPRSKAVIEVADWSSLHRK
jgi:c-di-GMP-related signal transduction protein